MLFPFTRFVPDLFEITDADLDSCLVSLSKPVWNNSKEDIYDILSTIFLIFSMPMN